MAKENKSKSKMPTNFWSSMKKVALSAFRLRIIFILFLIIVILISSLYILKGKEIAYAQDDPKNVPAKAANFTNNVTIDENGKISTAQTPLELWNELVENGSEITKYLDSAEDLSKLMNAQLVTQYMDTRDEKEIEKEIDWDSIYQKTDSTDVQGIIKMKRADSAGNETRMTYVDKKTFNSWIEQYNKNGDSEAKKNLISHFTLEEASSSSTGSTVMGIGDFCWPLPEGNTRITSKFGPRAQPVAGASTNHGGIDIGVPQGTEVYAAADGVVGFAGWQVPGNHKTGFGNYVRIEHENGYVTYYGHCSEVLVSSGEVVKKGQLIARSGSTGASSGPHLHFEVRENGITGTKIDPMKFFSTDGKTLQLSGKVNSSTETTNNNDKNDESDASTENSNVSTTATSLNNFLFLGDSVLGRLRSSLEGEGATVLYRSGARIGFFSQENNSGMDDTNCKLDNGSFDWNNNIANLSKPAGIGLILGHNDTGYSTDSSINSMKNLIGKLQNQFGSDVPIYIFSVLPCTTKKTGGYLEGQKKLNEALKSYCSSANNVTYVDILNGYTESTGYAKDDYVSDDSVYVHPSNTGVPIIFNNIKSGITGGSSSSSSGGSGSTGSGACALVATFQEIGYSEASDDPEESIAPSTKEYSAVTTRVYYQNMTSGYTMPFNYLWTWLVLTENKDFVMDLADLVYNSEIEFTVYENSNGVTDTKTVNYTRHKDVYTYARGNLLYDGDATGGQDSGATESSETTKLFYHSYTTTTENQTATVLLTKANVWMLDYELDYEEGQEKKIESTTGPEEMTDEKTVINLYGRNVLNGKHTNLGNNNLETIRNEILENNSGAIGVNWTEIMHTYNETKTNRSQTLKNIVTTQDYVSSSANVNGKTDKDSEEPNFVTIYLASRSAKQAVKDLDSWLFEYLEMNDDTKEMVDLTKYLLYVASGKNYGQVDFDFEEFTTSSSSFNSSTTIVGNELKEKVWNALKNLGYSDIAVAGAMGNIHIESGGFSPDIVEKGVSNGGIGLIQWSKGRKPKLIAYADSKGLSWKDEDTQIEFLIAEISGQGPASNYADVRRSGYIGSEHITSTSTEWANATTIEDSTLFFMRFFESPSDTSSYSQRTKWAHVYYEKYHQ